MRGICRLCGKKITANRSSHLKHEHGIETTKGSIKNYFLKPEEVGISKQFFEEAPEGMTIVTKDKLQGIKPLTYLDERGR